MKTETLLEAIEKQIEIISEKLGGEQRTNFVTLLDELATAENKAEMNHAKDNLIAFCSKNSALNTVLETTSEERPVVFRGKPQPKPLTEEARKIRLLANRIIDAIEKKAPSNLKKSNEN